MTAPTDAQELVRRLLQSADPNFYPFTPYLNEKSSAREMFEGAVKLGEIPIITKELLAAAAATISRLQAENEKKDRALQNAQYFLRNAMRQGWIPTGTFTLDKIDAALTQSAADALEGG